MTKGGRQLKAAHSKSRKGLDNRFNEDFSASLGKELFLPTFQLRPNPLLNESKISHFSPSHKRGKTQVLFVLLNLRDTKQINDVFLSNRGSSLTEEQGSFVLIKLLARGSLEISKNGLNVVAFLH